MTLDFKHYDSHRVTRLFYNVITMLWRGYDGYDDYDADAMTFAS